MARLLLSFVLLLLISGEGWAQLVYAWGANATGQLGNNSYDASSVPVPVDASGVFITQVSAGGDHSLALGTDGHAYLWGWNGFGQLGNNSFDESTVPLALNTSGVLNGVFLTQVAGGGVYSLALGSNGRVYAWGLNNVGQLGNNSNVNSGVPVAVDTSGVLNEVTITQVSGGASHSLALGSNGNVYAWGANLFGQLGNNSNTASNVPVAVNTTGALSGVNVSRIASGDLFSLAVGSNGRVYAWGSNAHGQLGNNSTTNSNVPVEVTTSGVLNGVTIIQVAAGSGFSMALGSNGRVYTWGTNTHGQLGNDSNTDSHVPVEVSSSLLNSLTVTQIASAAFTSYALTETGRLFAWGGDTVGELGQGIEGEDSWVPVEIPAPDGFYFTSVASGTSSQFVLTTVAPVPEPMTTGLLGGLAATGFVIRRRFSSHRSIIPR